MQNKQAVFRVKGMSRDLAASKFNPELAYEIRNMRLLATDDSTSLSLVNEKGTLDTGISLDGDVIGQAVFSDKLIVFVHKTYGAEPSSRDRIVQLTFSNSIPKELVAEDIYVGNLNLDSESPIEAIPLYESEGIQKVYWVDGRNQPRVINIKDEYTYSGTTEDPIDSQFDFLPEVSLGETFSVERVTDRGGMFPAGVLQYCITYSQKNGQESSIVWASEPLYTVFNNRGGSGNENTNAAYRITITDSDQNFDFINLYSILKTSESGEFIVRRIQRVPPSNSTVVIYDTNTTGEIVDSTSLLFKGGDKVVAGTMAAKDNTLFLGDLKTDVNNIDEQGLKAAARRCSVEEATTTRSIGKAYQAGIYYDYAPISTITNSFKYLKKENYYRIGVQLQDKYGKWSTPLFVDDLQANIAPKIDASNNIVIPTYQISIPQDAVDVFYDNEFKRIRPIIVYPLPNKRSVIAQGTVCPTVASVDQRLNGGIFSQSSWFFRPFNLSATDTDTIGNISVESRDLHFLSASDKYSAEIQSMSSVLDYADTDLNGHEDDHLNDYFVDSSLVTFHTPDVEALSDTDLQNAKFRITGYFYLNSASGRFNINATNVKNTSSAVLNNYVFKPSGATSGNNVDNILATRTLWKDSSYYLTYPWHRKGSLNDDAAGDSATDILETKVLANLRYSQRFLQLSTAWQATKGITTPVISTGEPNQLSILEPPKNVAYKAGLDRTRLNYYGGADSVITPTDDYHIYTASSINGTPTTTVDSIDPIPIRYSSTKHIVFAFNHNTDSSQVVLPAPNVSRYTQQSSRKVPFWLNPLVTPVSGYDGQNPYYVEQVVSEGTDIYNIALDDNWGKYVYHKIAECRDDQSPEYRVSITVYWLDGDNQLQSEPFTQPIDSQYDSITFGKTNDTTLTADTPYYLISQVSNLFQIELRSGTSDESHPIISEVTSPIDNSNEVMWIAELYRDIQTPQEVFGDADNDFDLEQNQWVPAGESISIEDDNPVELLITEGDTFFNRWDCLKTYPISTSDTNQLVEILSFMCESYTNLEGRYDKNRGLVDNTYINNTNFNLFNPVYNDTANYFRYRTLDFSEDRETEFPASITYSLTKTLGEEIDTWANVNLASTLNLDGDKGRISAIRRYNNDLIAFQPKGISQILFNEQIQIATSTGVPIEVANSGKVQGKRYISSEMGCLNKWSICESPNGLYFADDYTRDFYLMNGNGINSLTDRLGFHSWAMQNFDGMALAPWAITGGRFHTHYDRINNELLINNSSEVLAYSENLGQFSSFYDYYGLTFMAQLEDKNIMFQSFTPPHFQMRNTKVWIEHDGEYNKLFGDDKDFGVEVIVNQDPLTDKIFNTVEFRADDFDVTTNYYLEDSTFDKLNVEDEYQKGESDLTFNRNTPSSLKKKFRIWRANIPRWNQAVNGIQPNGRDRMRNPWLKVKLSKNPLGYGEEYSTTKTVLHDIVVDYLA